ncbi:hypothetical protein H4R20_003173 [Coemansia guatemalensis]|uniref:Uncharacterized protein n=1 Tax=Coemansia guatemalensis TaxID=2761395 RepID=A0A9W8LTA8_9FUNG|nr:hypothetical protein H4R20_003173 [Coemansia guatemalensis]
MADNSANAQFLAGARGLSPASVQTSSIASPTPPRPTNCPKASPIPGVDADDPLQKGVELAMRAVWLFLDSDFEKVEALLHKRRHRLLYASEGHAAIQYLRSMMTFTREAMADAQQAAESTINLAAYYRKPRGVSSMLSTPGSRTGSRSASPQTESKAQHRSHHQHHNENSASDSSTSKPHKQSESRSWFRMDSPRQILRDKKIKQGLVAGEDSASAPGSVGNTGDTTPAEEKRQDLDLSLLDAKYADLQDASSTPEPAVQTFPSASEAEDEDERALDRPQQRSWTSGIANVADSVIGAVRTGTQAIGITKPEWHVLKTMTPVQRHAELVYAEAYLLRAMVNIGMGDGVLALLKEGWHVRSAYATYRNCFAYIQDAYANGERLDDHFVSGTYLGMGVFNLVLSMLPAKLLRFIELVGFSADRRLGLELLAIAAGWRADPLTADLLGPPPSFADASLNGKAGDGSSKIHPCGYGLRSEFCTLVLLGYHMFLCSDLYLGYPNFPLVDVVLRRSLQQHPGGLMFMYFEARLLLLRSDMDGAIQRFGALVQAGKGAVDNRRMNNNLSEDASDAAADDSNDLVAELAALQLDDATSSETDADPNSDARSASSVPTESGESSGSDWRQLQYLGYWEQSLCLMALGRWLDAGAGFDVLRRENNWNKAAYTYALACCLWEHYLGLCGGVAPVDTAKLSNEQRQVLDVVCSLMALVPSLKRKVAGKSIPIEKFVIRKAAKFQQQGNFLMRPGLEMLHTMNLISKMPRARLLALRDEIEREIANMAQFMPISRGTKNPYRHIFYYDDLALLLLTKGAVLSELAYPTYATTLAVADPADGVTDPTLGPVAADTLLRLLRLMPMIQRDHYLAPIARFYLGDLYLAEHSHSKAWIGRARAQWKCVLNGKPLSSPPFLSLDEYRAHSEELTLLLEKDADKNAATAANNSSLLVAPGCQVEERILQDTGHPSLSFYDGTWQISEWRYMPPDWADSRKYSLENMVEVRTFNATNRLREKLDGEQGDQLLP